MVDPLAITLTLLSALLTAAASAKGNKKQCTALGARATRMADELGRLTEETRGVLNQRGTFETFNQTLKAAADFCAEFKGQYFLRRMLSYRADAAKFDDFNKRLSDVVAEASLALSLDERAWRDAQLNDGKDAETLLVRLDQGFSDMKDDMAGVGLVVENVYGKVDSLADQLTEMRQIMESMRAAQSKSILGTSQKETTLRLQFSDLEIWQINAKEIKFDREEDHEGERVKVQIGSGSFGIVYRGTYRKIPAAIKTAKLETEKDRDIFVAEVNIMSHLRHPNIGMVFHAKSRYGITFNANYNFAPIHL